MGISRDNRVLMAALFLWGMGEGLFVYIQPLYLRELGADPAQIGGALAAAAAAAILFHLPAGYLADRFGRKQVLLLGWLMGIFSISLMFAASTVGMFVTALVLYNTTTFVGGPINAYVVEARGAQTVQRALTLISAGYWGSTILSPALGGWIGQAFGLRWVYGLALVMAVLSTFAIAVLRPQPLAPPAPGQSRYRELFRNQRFIGFLALMFFAMLGIQTGLPLAPTFLQEVRGFDVQMVGLLGSVNSAGIVALNLLFGHRAPRRGFMLAQGLLAASLVILLTLTGWPWLVLAYSLRAGWSLARNMANAQVRRVVSAAESGLAFGLFETVNAVALTIGPLLAGQLYQRQPELPFQISLGLIVLAVPLVWRFAPRRDEHTVIEALGD